jgi:hypothetical protein
MMVNVDATKQTRGAVLDTTVLLVVVVAMPNLEIVTHDQWI